MADRVDDDGAGGERVVLSPRVDVTALFTTAAGFAITLEHAFLSFLHRLHLEPALPTQTFWLVMHRMHGGLTGGEVMGGIRL